MKVTPNPAFVRGAALAHNAPDFDYAAEYEARAAAEALEAGAPGVADRLLALCPVSLMDAACELDVPFKSIRGHALGLMRQGRARLLRGKLVKVSDER